MGEWGFLLPLIVVAMHNHLWARLALRPATKGENKFVFFPYHRAASGSTGSSEALDGGPRPCLFGVVVGEVSDCDKILVEYYHHECRERLALHLSPTNVPFWHLAMPSSRRRVPQGMLVHSTTTLQG